MTSLPSAASAGEHLRTTSVPIDRANAASDGCASAMTCSPSRMASPITYHR